MEMCPRKRVNSTTTYKYDGAGDRTSVQVGSGTAVSTSYDSAGFPTSSSDGTTYTVDPDGELTQVAGGTTKNYGYDTWGRMTSGAGASFVYDPIDRTTSATAGSVLTSYTYSGSSQDVAQSSSSAATVSYAYTPGGPLAQKSGSATRYFVTNPHSDVVALLNKTNGSVKGTASFDPWGVVRAVTNETSLLGFQGDPTDSSTGFVDMGTRYYDPNIGRFSTRDTVFGLASDPTSLNQFIYAQDSPSTYIDPNGMRIEGGGGGGTCQTRSCEEWLQKQEDQANGSYTSWGHGSSGTFTTVLIHSPTPPALPLPKPACSGFLGCLVHHVPSAGSWVLHHPYEAIGIALTVAVVALSVAAVIPALMEAGGYIAASLTAGAVATEFESEATSTTAVGEAAGAAEGEAGPANTLFHYTTEEGQKGILDSGQLNPSLKSVNLSDARYGDGQYLSDIAPGTKTGAQLSRSFINNPFQGARFTNYVEIDTSGLNVVQGRPGVFVVPGQTPLDLTGRIVSWGSN